MLSFLIFFSLIGIISSQNPLVITKYGPVVGTTYTTTNGAKVSEFIGVPFAAPPIGNLRFEKPQSPIPWTTPKNVIAYQPAYVPWIHNDECSKSLRAYRSPLCLLRKYSLDFVTRRGWSG